MSFDLTIFDPADAPKDAEAFGDWLEAAEEDGDWAVTDEACTEPLKRFFSETCRRLPPLNGPDAPSDEHVDDMVTGDYNLSRSLIQVSLPFSAAEETVPAILTIAAKHGLGLYDPQGGQVYLPTGPGGALDLAFEI